MVRLQIDAPAALSPRKEPVTYREEAVWATQLVAMPWSREKSNPGRQARSLVTIPTELFKYVT
jgi:hypothetical protein